MDTSKDFSLAALRTFVAVIDCGGFTAAAHRMHITQPSVSQQIKKLEAQVGSPLLVRGTRVLRPTSAGERLLEFARRMVQLNDQAVTALTKPAIAGTLRLGLPHEFTFSLLPRIVGAFSQIHPGVVVEVECELSRELLDRCDDYDIVLALHDRGDRGGGVLLRKEPLRWVSSESYQPAANQPILIAAAPEPCMYRQTMERQLEGRAGGWSLFLTSTSYGALCGAVSSGVGVTLLAESVIPEHLSVVGVEGASDLGALELRMHRSAGGDDSVVSTFESFLIDQVAEGTRR